MSLLPERYPKDYNELTNEQRDFIQQFLTTMFEGKLCPHCHTPIEKKEQVSCCVYARPCNHRLYHGSVDLEPGETPTVSFDLKNIP